jgi:hypothetical protein
MLLISVDFELGELCHLYKKLKVYVSFLTHYILDTGTPKLIITYIRIPVMRVNSTNVLDEGLRIGEIGRRINSKVKSVKQGVYQK